jgi:hypothetical protein
MWKLRDLKGQHESFQKRVPAATLQEVKSPNHADNQRYIKTKVKKGN